LGKHQLKRDRQKKKKQDNFLSFFAKLLLFISLRKQNNHYLNAVDPEHVEPVLFLHQLKQCPAYAPAPPPILDSTSGATGVDDHRSNKPHARNSYLLPQPSRFHAKE
jgi:hypothetical protein